ncbi:MAG TPA: methyltransferase domain-containing protein [Bacteroidetes bacterium]|nr:methyltransferase domain-containing protein [Bacteroidota bacterium]
MKIKQIAQLLLEENVNNFILRTKKKKVRKFPKGYNGLNLGCGYTNPKNWIGIDGSFLRFVTGTLPSSVISKFIYENKLRNQLEEKQLIIHHNLNYGIPFQDNCVPNIYSAHFIEHILKEQVSSLLLEAFRVMKPDGYIRICVPSLKANIEHIKQSIKKAEKGDTEDIQLYLTNRVDKYVHPNHYHKWTYYEDELVEMLNAAGFNNVKSYNRHEGNIPDIKILDHRDGIFVEGQKK